MDVRVGLWRKLSAKELMLWNYGVGEDSWESLGLQGDQSWIFIGRIDAEAEAPAIWPPDAKSWLIRKVPDAGKDWRQEKGMTEDKMVGWHHRLNGHKFEQALGDDEGQGSLVCRVQGVAKSWTWLRNWIPTTVMVCKMLTLRKLKESPTFDVIK